MGLLFLNLKVWRRSRAPGVGVERETRFELATPSLARTGSKDYLALDPEELMRKHRRLARDNERAAAFLARRALLPIAGVVLAMAAALGAGDQTAAAEPTQATLLVVNHADVPVAWAEWDFEVERVNGPALHQEFRLGAYGGELVLANQGHYVLSAAAPAGYTLEVVLCHGDDASAKSPRLQWVNSRFAITEGGDVYLWLAGGDDVWCTFYWTLGAE